MKISILVLSLAGALLGGCATGQMSSKGSVQSAEPTGALAGTSWRLVHFQSSDDAIGTIVPPNAEHYTLRFLPGGILAMRLDCNRATARWEAKASSARGGALVISPATMAYAMCPPGAIDARLARDMDKVRSYTFARGRLNLALEADAGIYVWEPAAGED